MRTSFGFSSVMALLRMPMRGCCSVMVTAGVLLIVVYAPLGVMAVKPGCSVAMVAMASMVAMVVRRASSLVMVAMAVRVSSVSITAGVAMVARRGCCSVTAAAVATGCMCLLLIVVGLRVCWVGLLFRFPVWAAMVPMAGRSTATALTAVMALTVRRPVRMVSPAVMVVTGD